MGTLQDTDSEITPNSYNASSNSQ